MIYYTYCLIKNILRSHIRRVDNKHRQRNKFCRFYRADNLPPTVGIVKFPVPSDPETSLFFTDMDLHPIRHDPAHRGFCNPGIILQSLLNGLYACFKNILSRTHLACCNELGIVTV